MSGLPQFRRFGDGNCFFGSLNAGQPHGPGRIYVEATGETVSEVVDDVISSNSGRWDNGKLNGRGMQLFPNGDRYEGLFKDHLFEGLGVCTWKDGSIYEGEWSQGKRAGLGALWDSQGKLDECGQRTDGKFVDSCAVPMRLIPQGKLLSAAAQQAKRDHPNGSALLQKGSYYVGPLNERGQPHGFGATFHPDGSPRWTLQVDPADASNSGRFVDGELQGRAIQVHLNGDRSEGLFKDSQLEGLGVFSGHDGDRYEGPFSEGLFHGLGALWENGKLAECGRWDKGELAESCAVPLSMLPEKRFLSDHAKCFASLLLPDGSYFVGAINAANQRHGVGQLYSAKGDMLARGTWLNDQPQPGMWISPQLPSGPPSFSSAQVAPITAASSHPSIAVAAAAASSSFPLKRNRRALLIGNDAYRRTPLSCCVRDARDMQSALMQLGFLCTLLENGTRDTMLSAIRTFVASLQPSDITFIYFSGHGAESNGITYLQPVNWDRSCTLRDDAVNLSHILSDLNQKHCDLLNILVLDCCRSNDEDHTFKGAATAIDKSGASFVGKPAAGHYFIAYSSDPGTVSFETHGARNSLFTGCLLEHLCPPACRGLLIEQIFKRTNKSLRLKSQQLALQPEQRSWQHMTIEDDLILDPTTS